MTGFGMAAWFGSLLFNVTRFGDAVTLAFRDGYVAAYWGDSANYANSFVLNQFTWPFFGHGAGMDWTPEWRWEAYGPRDTLSAWSLEGMWNYPQYHLGLTLPGVSLRSELSYVGLPLWTLVVAGVMTVAGTRSRAGPGDCSSCGYDIRGLPDAVCPECGGAIVPAGALKSTVQVVENQPLSG